SLLYFFFQAEDGIRDFHVTGVQTCALPISSAAGCRSAPSVAAATSWRCSTRTSAGCRTAAPSTTTRSPWQRVPPSTRRLPPATRSEERRVGKEDKTPTTPRHANADMDTKTE